MTSVPRVLRPAFAALALGLAGRATAETTLVTKSPFAPAVTASVAQAAAPDDAFQLIGVISRGQDSVVGILDRTANRTRWIPVGETVDGLKVNSYDRAQDIAVITSGGVQKFLQLRKAVVAAANNVQTIFNPIPTAPVAYGAPSGAPAPQSFATPTPAQPQPAIVNPADAGKSPDIIAKETEARMMVSDLLEIGMAQRKEYERKQREAQEAQKTKG